MSSVGGEREGSRTDHRRGYYSTIVRREENDEVRWEGGRKRHGSYRAVDYHTPHHEANLKQLYPTSIKVESTRYKYLFVLSFICGVLMAFVGVLIRIGIFWIYTGVYELSQNVLIESGRFSTGVVVFLLLTLFLATIASILVVFVSPLAAGSGIPEIKSQLNGVFIPNLVTWKTFIVKAGGVCLSIASGFVCGKEGPMIHSGGIVGAGVAVAASRALNSRIPYRWWDSFRTEEWKRDFLALGAGTGVAIAFQAPIGSVLFVVEEAATHWNSDMSVATLLSTTTAVIVSGILEAVREGRFTFNMSEFGPLAGINSQPPFFLRDMGYFLLIALSGGLFGGLMSLIQKPLTLFRFKYMSRPSRRLLEAMGMSLLTNILRVVLPTVASVCTPRDEAFVNAIARQKSEDYSRFNCAEGEYNALGSIVWVPLEVSISNLMHNSNNHAWSAWLLVMALAFYAVLTIFTYGIAVPSGLFIPAFIVGALIGRLVGLLALTISPEREVDFSMSSFVFIGAVAGLAGATRMTMSVVMIAAETSSFATGLLPAFLVSLIAKSVGDSISEEIYDLHIHLKKVPYLEPRTSECTDLYYKLQCSDVMVKDIVAVFDTTTVRDLIHVLKSFHHATFPVVSRIDDGSSVDDDGDVLVDEDDEQCVENRPPPRDLIDLDRYRFCGIVQREVVVSLLKHYTTLVSAEDGRIDLLPRNRYDVAYPNTKLLSLEKEIIEAIPMEIVDAKVDLTPYVDPNPPTICDTATAAEVREFFRSRGNYQAICISLERNSIVGVITRSDILPEILRQVDADRDAADGAQGAKTDGTKNKKRK